MVRLHSSGKSLCGMRFQSQCASWFWQSHVVGSEGPLESFQGPVPRLFVAGEDDIMRMGSGMSLVFVFIHIGHLFLDESSVGCGGCGPIPC
jgi:hypothetical protein